VPKQPGLPPPTIARAAPPPPVAEPVPQADTTPAAPLADAAPSPPQAKPETQAAKPVRVAAVPPKKPVKPATVAKAYRASPPQTVALHPPPTAPGNVAGPYRIQFGAFANEDNARRVQWAIEATGLKVDVSHETGPSGHPLYFLRSPVFADYASALSSAQTVQNRVQGFVNAIPIDYAILGDHSAIVQQAER
jgi:septal ring-binding cell division protein DamX